MKQKANLEVDIINSVEFYPNGDIRSMTLNRLVRSNKDYFQYYKEFELRQREFYDRRNASGLR